MSQVSGVKGEGVATAIGAIKWVLIALAILGGGIGALSALASGSSYDSLATTLIVVATALWCLFVWVLFGWFEHTLSALVAIARNTSPPLVLPHPTHPATDLPHPTHPATEWERQS